MKVYTHYPALAMPIQRAGYEPVLLEPLIIEKGKADIAVVERIDGSKVVVIAHPDFAPITLEPLRE